MFLHPQQIINFGDPKDLKTCWEYESCMMLENGSNQLVTCSSKGSREQNQQQAVKQMEVELIASNHVEREPKSLTAVK